MRIVDTHSDGYIRGGGGGVYTLCTYIDSNMDVWAYTVTDILHRPEDGVY